MAHSHHYTADTDDRIWVKKARERYVRQRKQEMLDHDELIDFDAQVRMRRRSRSGLVSG